MIVSCPECSVKFMIENEAFGEAPRKVRCGKCAHVWKQDPPSAEDVGVSRQVRLEQKENLQQMAADKQAGVEPNLPTVVKASKAVKLLKVACWLFFIANVVVFILLNKQLIGQTAFYDLIGDYDTAGVEIDGIKFDEPFKSDGNTTYYFDWGVKNARAEPMQLPHYKLSLLDADKQGLFTSEAIAGQETLAANGEFMFNSNKLVDETGEGRYVVIEIGNAYEIESRD